MLRQLIGVVWGLGVAALAFAVGVLIDRVQRGVWP